MTRCISGKLARALIGTLLVAALTSCGLKGDLYLPEPEQAGAAGQPRDTDETAATKAIMTAPNGVAAAADEDTETAAGKPSESAPSQP